jgi:hypothetical protein
MKPEELYGEFDHVTTGIYIKMILYICDPLPFLILKKM